MNSDYLKFMKKELGTKCTFLSYSKEGDKDCILVNFSNSSGGKDKIRIPLPKEFSKLTLDDCNFIYNELVQVRDNGERS